MRLWILIFGLLAAGVAGTSWFARRAGRKALLRFRARVDRFKLASRKSVRERLLRDPAIGDAVRARDALPVNTMIGIH